MESPLIRRDEIYLASFPFGDRAAAKLRPVLTLTGPVGVVPEVLVAYISSVIPEPLIPSDVVLVEIGIEKGPTWALNWGPPELVGERPAGPFPGPARPPLLAHSLSTV